LSGRKLLVSSSTGSGLASRQASTSDDNFVVNFGGDVKTWKKSIEEVKASKLGQNNKRR